MSGGGSGQQQSTTQTSQQLPQWEREPAKAYLSSLMGYVFPGTTVPSSWFNTAGESFPTSGVNTGIGTGGVGGGGQGGGTTAAAQMLQQIDPSGTSYSLFSPMISGSPYLQSMAAQNPAAFAGAVSPAAASQLAGLYGGYPGLGNTPAAANPADLVMGQNPLGGFTSSGQPDTFGGVFSPAAGIAAGKPPSTSGGGSGGGGKLSNQPDGSYLPPGFSIGFPNYKGSSPVGATAASALPGTVTSSSSNAAPTTVTKQTAKQKRAAAKAAKQSAASTSGDSGN